MAGLLVQPRQLSITLPQSYIDTLDRLVAEELLIPETQRLRRRKTRNGMIREAVKEYLARRHTLPPDDDEEPDEDNGQP